MVIGHAVGVREQHRDLHAPQHRRPPARSTAPRAAVPSNATRT
jgi:hypothetical protein